MLPKPLRPGKRTTLRNFPCLFLLLLPGGHCLASTSDWQPLFNGRDLSGWTIQCQPKDRSTEYWTVQDGAIACDSIDRPPQSYVWLVSDREFSDFELRLKFQVYTNSTGNSGLQFRSRFEPELNGGWLNGPQVDIHPPTPHAWRTGLIYDETLGEQRWVYPSLPDWRMPAEHLLEQPLLRYGEDNWNDLVLICRGSRILTIVNGTPRTDWESAGVLDNPLHRAHRVGRSGHFALQLHSGDRLRIRFKDIEIKQSPTLAPPTLPEVSKVISQSIGNHEVLGAVTLVASKDAMLHHEATGLADLAAAAPMQPDSIFWIASMTKPVTAVAILMLQEEGKLSVDDPIATYLPELGTLTAPTGKPAQLTLRHLLTHTSGMPEATREQYKTARTLADVIPFYSNRSVAFEPGTKWQYCQSGINSLGRIVEVVSGLSFPEFLERRIFAPLGMRDTGFYLTEIQLQRLAKSYALNQDVLSETPLGFLNGYAPTFADRYPAPNGGLFSTATDYARFCRMLLNEGTLERRQLLRPETVKLLSQIHTDQLKTGFTEGNGWGLGVCVVLDPQGVTADLSPGSFGHGGAYGTQAWIDPVKDRIYILMVQRANFPNSDASNLRRAFQHAAALSE